MPGPAIGMRVPGVDEAGLLAVVDAIEGVKIGDGVDRSLVQRRHQRRRHAERRLMVGHANGLLLCATGTFGYLRIS